MSICGCNFRCGCTAAALIASLLTGVIGAFLQITAAITLTTVIYWVLLGSAVAELGILTLTAGDHQLCTCSCAALNAVLLGILGTILFAGILLVVTFPATSILGAIAVGALFASFALIITATVCLVRALNGCNS